VRAKQTRCDNQNERKNMNKIGDIIYKGSQYAIRKAGQHAIVCGFNGEPISVEDMGWDGESVVKTDVNGDEYNAALVDEATPGADFGDGRNEVVA
jgi:hypothetical protein